MRVAIFLLLLASCASGGQVRDPGPPAQMAPLDRELIRRVIQSHRSEIRHCYESELERQPGLAGKIAIRFVIGAQGAVTSASSVSTTMSSPPVETCLVARVRSWRFPRPRGGGIVIVTYPFVFTQPRR